MTQQSQLNISQQVAAAAAKTTKEDASLEEETTGVEQPTEELTEEQKKAVCKSLWEPVKVKTTVVLPMAQNWYSGMPIRDTDGNELFQVMIARSVTFESLTGATQFKYRQAVLTSPDGYFGAFITNKYGGKSFLNWLHFAVYTPLPHYEGQLPVDVWKEYGRLYIPDELDCVLGSLYQYGKFIVTDAWNDVYSFLQCIGHDEYQEQMRLSKETIRSADVSKILGICLPCLCWKKHVVKFQHPDSAVRGRGDVLVERDQKKETLTVATGQSVLAAICAAYATDQLLYGCAPNCPCD